MIRSGVPRLARFVDLAQKIVRLRNRIFRRSQEVVATDEEAGAVRERDKLLEPRVVIPNPMRGEMQIPPRSGRSPCNQGLDAATSQIRAIEHFGQRPLGQRHLIYRFSEALHVLLRIILLDVSNQIPVGEK